MTYLRRAIWFLAAKALIWTAALGTAACVFFMCMNTSNIYVVLSEGMEKRVDAILTKGDVYALTTWFRQEFLAGDPALAGAVNGSSAYSDYNIRNYRYDLDILSIWAWPWDSYATCTVAEKVTDIEGSVKAGSADKAKKDPPAWQSGRFTVTLMREGGKWKIAGLRQTAIIADLREDD